MLTKLELDTIDALYDTPDQWWEWVWVLSDRVQEENEVAGEGLRFLFVTKQRPKMEMWLHEGLSLSFGWFGLHGGHDRDRTWRCSHGLDNCIPARLDLWLSDRFSSCSEAVSEFLTRWVALSPVERQKITAEWTQEATCG